MLHAVLSLLFEVDLLSIALPSTLCLLHAWRLLFRVCCRIVLRLIPLSCVLRGRGPDLIGHFFLFFMELLIFDANLCLLHQLYLLGLVRVRLPPKGLRDIVDFRISGHLLLTVSKLAQIALYLFSFPLFHCLRRIVLFERGCLTLLSLFDGPDIFDFRILTGRGLVLDELALVLGVKVLALANLGEELVEQLLFVDLHLDEGLGLL